MRSLLLLLLAASGAQAGTLLASFDGSFGPFADGEPQTSRPYQVTMVAWDSATNPQVVIFPVGDEWVGVSQWTDINVLLAQPLEFQYQPGLDTGWLAENWWLDPAWPATYSMSRTEFILTSFSDDDVFLECVEDLGCNVYTIYALTFTANIYVVPEPSEFVLWIIGFHGLWTRRRVARVSAG